MNINRFCASDTKANQQNKSSLEREYANEQVLSLLRTVSRFGMLAVIKRIEEGRVSKSAI